MQNNLELRSEVKATYLPTGLVMVIDCINLSYWLRTRAVE